MTRSKIADILVDAALLLWHERRKRNAQGGINEVEQFLTKQGLNAQQLVAGSKGVTSKAEEAINYASPTVKSTASTISATSPQILAQYAFALVGVYYLVKS